MKYLKVWTSFREDISALGDAEKGRLFVAMLEYAESGEEPTISGNERFIWPIAKKAIDLTAKANAQLRENGEKGGRRGETNENQTEPNRTKANQTEPNETKPGENGALLQSLYIKDKDKDKDKENDKDKDKEKGESIARGGKPRFTPPTVDEVRDYCDERHNNVNAERFVDFYESKGWRVGSQPMKDWRAAVRTWENRDDRPGQAEKPKRSSNPFFDMLKAEQAKRAVEVEPEIERW